jgi:hypothetical protein
MMATAGEVVVAAVAAAAAAAAAVEGWHMGDKASNKIYCNVNQLDLFI